jgi:hypothetical protein
MKSLWKILRSMDNTKICERGDASIANIVNVTIILTNCHTCLYGGLTNDYFDMEAPDLETYLNFH